MNETNDKQKEKDEALQRRKEELEEELENYARAGAFSPGLIKATKWVSRGLYLAMAIGFMAMLFSGWGKVSQEEFDRVHEGYTKWKKEAEEEKKAREEAQDALVQAELKAARLKLEAEAKAETDAVGDADGASEGASAALELLAATPEAARLASAYREASEPRRLMALALYAEVAAADPDGVMRMVATSQRPLAEKLVAVRWMGDRKDADSKELLKTLSEGQGVLAEEAKAALKKLE